MERLFGTDWHTTREGKLFLEDLAQPSTLLYGLLERGARSTTWENRLFFWKRLT